MCKTASGSDDVVDLRVRLERHNADGKKQRLPSYRATNGSKDVWGRRSDHKPELNDSMLLTCEILSFCGLVVSQALADEGGEDGGGDVCGRQAVAEGWAAVLCC